MVFIAWTILIGNTILNGELSHRLIILLTQLASGGMIIQYQALAYFMETIFSSRFTSHKAIYRALLIAGLLLFCWITTYAVCQYAYGISSLSLMSYSKQNIQELRILYTIALLLFNFMMIPSLNDFLSSISKKELPKLVRRKARFLLQMFIAPFLLAMFCVGSAFVWYQMTVFIAIMVSSAILLLALSLRYVAYMMIQQPVEIVAFQQEIMQQNNASLAIFKQALEQLSVVRGIADLYDVVLAFFRREFQIPLRSITLQICSADQEVKDPILKRFEQLSLHEQLPKILVYDEIDFAHFYHENSNNHLALCFLRELSSDVFLPIFHLGSLIGYLSISHDARPSQVYTPHDQSVMMLFIGYLGPVISLLRQNRGDHIIQRKRQLGDQLFVTHQETILYREYMKRMSSIHHKHEPALVLYKGGRLVCLNDAAHQLITVSTVLYDRDPITRECLTVALRAEGISCGSYSVIRCCDNKMLLISGSLHVNLRGVLLVITPASSGDLIAQQQEYVRECADIPYLIYLEKTRTGRIINRLFPAIGELTTPLKILLLKISISRDSVLLYSPSDDIDMIVYTIHQASMRESLDVVDPRLCDSRQMIEQIVTKTERLTHDGDRRTLFIRDVDQLPIELQRLLGEALLCGMWYASADSVPHPFRLRLLCSTSKNLMQMAQDGQFCRVLADQLLQQVVTIPAPSLLSRQELDMLINGLVHMMLPAGQRHKIMLSDRDKEPLFESTFESYSMLRSRVTQALRHKTQVRIRWSDDIRLVPTTSGVALFNRHAIKDRKKLQVLWDQFKSHRRIAMFLGVHRSSVYKQCIRYDIGREISQ